MGHSWREHLQGIWFDLNWAIPSPETASPLEVTKGASLPLWLKMLMMIKHTEGADRESRFSTERYSDWPGSSNSLARSDFPRGRACASHIVAETPRQQ